MEKILGEHKMITLKNLGIVKQVNLWSNVEIDEHAEHNEILEIMKKEIKLEKWNEWNEISYLVELCIKNKPASNYAKLGMKYLKNNIDELVIKVNISSDEGIILEETIATLGDEVHLGIPKEYGEEVLNKATKFLNEKGCAKGELVFDIGAHGYYGSSQTIFGMVTLILLGLLTSKINNIEDLEQNLKKEINCLK